MVRQCAPPVFTPITTSTGTGMSYRHEKKHTGYGTVQSTETQRPTRCRYTYTSRSYRTVQGDPFKDTAGPSLHVLIKLLATVSLVLGPVFISPMRNTWVADRDRASPARCRGTGRQRKTVPNPTIIPARPTLAARLGGYSTVSRSLPRAQCGIFDWGIID